MTRPPIGPPTLHRAPLLRWVAFSAIPRVDWDRLLLGCPWATPFARWTFHRAWWDAYGTTAQPHYLVLDGDGSSVRAIVPLMIRHEPGVAGSSLYFGASYHADYATILAHPDDVPEVASALVRHLEEELESGRSFERVDLRRMRADDPLAGELTMALRSSAEGRGWTVTSTHEQVCPVVDLASDWAGQLAGLDKKSRHEIRRKLRRAESRGRVILRYLPLAQRSADHFIRFHQARWGTGGLFADTVDGERGRLFLRRLVELEGAEGALSQFHLAEVTIDDRPVYVLAGFAANRTCYFYNAGMDPSAADVSPGVVGTALYVRDRIERGDARFDFLRGDERYKYEWGAVDETIERITIERPSSRG